MFVRRVVVHDQMQGLVIGRVEMQTDDASSFSAKRGFVDTLNISTSIKRFLRSPRAPMLTFQQTLKSQPDF